MRGEGIGLNAVGLLDFEAGGAAAILSMVERAASDPACDLERLDRLVDVYERSLARCAEAAFNLALVKLQPKLPILDEKGAIAGPDGEVLATYATWEDTVEVVRPLLARHGFSLTFRPGRSSRGEPTVTGVLRHHGGHKEEATLELPVDASGDKNAVQAVGSTMSYGQRYVARMLLNLVSRGEDDDGGLAGQSNEAYGAIVEINQIETEAGFMDWKRRNRTMLSALRAAEFQRVIGHYSDRRRRVRAKSSEAA